MTPISDRRSARTAGKWSSGGVSGLLDCIAIAMGESGGHENACASGTEAGVFGMVWRDRRPVSRRIPLGGCRVLYIEGLGAYKKGPSVFEQLEMRAERRKRWRLERMVGSTVDAHIQRTRRLFSSQAIAPAASFDVESQRVGLYSRVVDEYSEVREGLPEDVAERLADKQNRLGPKPLGRDDDVSADNVYGTSSTDEVVIEDATEDDSSNVSEVISSLPQKRGRTDATAEGYGNKALVVANNDRNGNADPGSIKALTVHQPRRRTVLPDWHAPWKLFRVISGHTGWIRCVDVDPSNDFFVTGSNDRTIKIWDLASGTLKLTLTGHISAVRDVALSQRSPYLFSVGEDKMIKCWDLEVNKSIRQYHGHLSGIYTCAVHPTIDILFTAGRDGSVRVWDVRTKQQIMCMVGHKNTVADIVAQTVDPQVISGSHDSTIRCWDLRKGKTMTVLTHHKRSVRALDLHPLDRTFVSASADSVKKWHFGGEDVASYIHNMQPVNNRSGQQLIMNCLSMNEDGVVFGGADNGQMAFWDYKTGYCFQREATVVQPGSLASEGGIFGSAFDKTGTRLITVEADKTIKMWREDAEATPETHPVETYNPNKDRR